MRFGGVRRQGDGAPSEDTTASYAGLGAGLAGAGTATCLGRCKELAVRS